MVRGGERSRVEWPVSRANPASQTAAWLFLVKARCHHYKLGRRRGGWKELPRSGQKMSTSPEKLYKCFQKIMQSGNPGEGEGVRKEAKANGSGSASFKSKHNMNAIWSSDPGADLQKLWRRLRRPRLPSTASSTAAKASSTDCSLERKLLCIFCSRINFLTSW